MGNKSELKTTTVLVPGFDTIYDNTMDNEPSGWSGDGRWAQEKSPGRGLVWSDSPGQDYGPNLNTSLTSEPIDLTGFGAPVMLVDYRVDLAAGDALFLEASEDGQHWSGVSQIWSQDADFRSTRFDLEEYQGKKVQFRFRLVTDEAGGRSGVSVDRVRVIGAKR